MTKVHCIATLPLAIPDGVEFRFLNDMEHVVPQILECLNHNQLDFDEFGSISPVVYLPDSALILDLAPMLWKEVPVRLLRLEYHADITGTETGWGHVSEESIRSASEFLAMKTAKILNDIVVAANVANPGSVTSLDGQVTVGNCSATPVLPLSAASVRDAALTSERTGWPRIVSLRFGQVWEWVQRQPGFHAGFSDDPTSRALIALTNVMASTDLMQLFWSLVGIEALFVGGSGNIRQKLRRNTEALLGPRRKFGEVIDRMYSIRSELIHGAADIPTPMMANPFKPGVEEYFEGLYETVAVAVSVLVAALQDMARRDWDVMSFDNNHVVSGGIRPGVGE